MPANLPITDVVSIYKQIRTGNKEAYAATPAYTNVNSCISPTGTDIQPSEGGIASYQLFEIFIWDTTVQISNGDKLVSGSTNYLVTGSPNTYSNRYVQGIRTLAKVII
jgi:hypothetical protein